MKNINLSINADETLSLIKLNIETMDLISFKKYGYSQLTSNIPINDEIKNSIIQRMKKENLTLEQLK